MATNSLNDWSTTPANNLDIAGTSIAVGCAPQDVGVYMRTAMAQVAYAVQGAGGPIPATWNVGTLNAVNVVVSGSLSVVGTPPGVQYGDVKFSALGIEGGGWRLCYGQWRPRTDPLWTYLVANGLTSTWIAAYGGGDGSTYYTMPDARDRVLAGLGNMGGTDLGLITAAISGLNGASLGARGGGQKAQNPGLSISGSANANSTVNDPTHAHTTGVEAMQFAGGGATGYVGPGHTSAGFQYWASNYVATGITVSTTVALSLSASSSLTGTTQNIQPTMMMPVLMYVGA